MEKVQLQPHQERMLNELNELSNRIEKLDNFIDNNPIYGTLDSEEQLDMKAQSLGMKNY